MARNADLRSLIENFVSSLEVVVRERVNNDFAARFDELRERILDGVTSAPRAPGKKTAAKAASKRRGPLAGTKAALKPCPVCGTPNKARRYSYLCDEHRTAANQKKFKGAAKAAVPAKAKAPRKGAKGTRGKAKEAASTAPAAAQA